MDIAARERASLRVAGPDARDYLQRMVSNDVEALPVGQACPALLLTAKARVIAPVVVLRRGDDDYLVLTEPELGEVVRALLTRMRLRAKCEIEPEEHSSLLVFGGDEGFATDFAGARELLDSGLVPTLDADELELRRIEAGVPRWGREIDDRILPAEAGLDATHVNFGKGCYPGQEPVARLHYRGHPNRTLRVLELSQTPEYDAELVHEGKAVGRVTSAAQREDGSVVALAYVRTEVPADAPLELAHATA
ncbi:MAG: tRNA-modifying protein YgfZ [Gaiellaceae bacterium]|jgi:folate-binding protein YgfZ|nr:tRNA-modifying protein YgfZ [Gaiellaceae bacterium]